MRFDANRPVQLFTLTHARHSLHATGLVDPIDYSVGVHSTAPTMYPNTCHGPNKSCPSFLSSVSSSGSMPSLSSPSLSQDMKDTAYSYRGFGLSTTDRTTSLTMAPSPRPMPAKVVHSSTQCTSAFGLPTSVDMSMLIPPQPDSHPPPYGYRPPLTDPESNTMAPPRHVALPHPGWPLSPSSVTATTPTITTAAPPTSYYSLPHNSCAQQSQPPIICMAMPQPIAYQDVMSCNAMGAFEPNHWTVASYLSAPQTIRPDAPSVPTPPACPTLPPCPISPPTHRNKHARPASSPPLPHSTSTCDSPESPDAKAMATPRRYKCQVCVKRFTRPSSLATHMHSHTGEKPYECTVKGCGRRFSVVSNLRRHSKIHANHST